MEKVKKFFLDLLFPKFCLGCQKEGTFLCPDCEATLEILTEHYPFKTKYLDDLYFSCLYDNPLIKKLIQKFKYPPFIKELALPLTNLIIHHFQLIEKSKDFFSGALVLPIPISKKRLRWRGYNQAFEIAKGFAKFFNLEIDGENLVKIKETKSQVELSEKERKENVKNCFSILNKNLIFERKIFLIDDIYTTGSTMEEAASLLKREGAKEVIGIVIAKAKFGQDR
jgi:ComF family protein